MNINSETMETPKQVLTPEQRLVAYTQLLEDMKSRPNMSFFMCNELEIWIEDNHSDNEAYWAYPGASLELFPELHSQMPEDIEVGDVWFFVTDAVTPEDWCKPRIEAVEKAIEEVKKLISEEVAA